MKKKILFIFIIIVCVTIIFIISLCSRNNQIKEQDYYSQKNKVSIVLKNTDDIKDTLFFEKSVSKIIKIVEEEQKKMKNDSIDVYFDEPICNVGFYVLDDTPKYSIQIDFPSNYILTDLNKTYIDRIGNRLFYEDVLNDRIEIGLKTLLPKKRPSLEMPLPPSMIK